MCVNLFALLRAPFHRGIGKSLNGKLQVWFQKQMACLSSPLQNKLQKYMNGLKHNSRLNTGQWASLLVAMQNVHHIASWLWADVLIFFRSRQQFERETMLFFAFQSWFLGAF